VDTGIFQERETFFVEVVLPLPLSINYTYRVPFELNESISLGKRVVVQFGSNKIYTALIHHISTQAPQHYEAKYIIDVIDDTPVVNKLQFAFWDWISTYYLCSLGEVMAAALPTGLKLASETVLVIDEETAEDQTELTDKEKIIVAALHSQNKLSINEVMQLLGQKTVYPIIQKLIEKRKVVILEEVVEKYKPLLKSYISLNHFYREEEHLQELFDLLKKAPKQVDLLLAYLKLAKQQGHSIAQDVLLEESASSTSALKALLDKDIFWKDKKVVSRLRHEDEIFSIDFKLSNAQEQALGQIKAHFTAKEVVLLHGVTASGKTQIYIKLIEQFIENGGQVLFLLPEIALTTQIVERIKLYFGAKLGVYHSKFNDNERVEIWNKVNDGSYRVVIGARSAVFLPFQSLNLVVVDEEHESSYKQIDPAPRYHARDAAIYLAHLHGAKTLLGSATPSLETYYNTEIAKYGLLELHERFGGVQLPEQTIVSMAQEAKEKKMTNYFTSVLLNQIAEALANQEQVILFQNRRGYATILLCATCGFAPKCVNCDVTLTYHKTSGKLHCHYCGYHQSSLSSCPACGSVHLVQKGFGTERIEEELELLFPEAKIARLDLDSTRGKYSLQKIIGDFQDKKTQILIGTQMVAKGLDFDNVSLIGVMNADTLLNYPDFRAFERSFQLLAQVAGRAGRRDKQGKVLIQAYSENHRVLQQVMQNDYLQMYNTEMQDRKQFHYPPFAKLIFLNVKHHDAGVLHQAALELATDLRSKLGKRVLGPEQPLVGKVKNLYIKQIVLKVERNAAMQKVKATLVESIRQLNSQKTFRSIWVQVDVDPN